ncbi:hypothetical protein [Xylophilus ampelinus]|uniref:PXPV repeat-containing protein n=1 Tax=Xylophilus ampelinus TaxID=54067 RepID=A0A318SNC6_9BURK|nr:hypothetical protein [Xylophilus ampelinus]MCS4509773.1 hypothetical protein [Xylophilus ampelinus]PYE78699.1 hypothetical protein DFQ15_10558 [Xylophilus ampelinus]
MKTLRLARVFLLAAAAGVLSGCVLAPVAPVGYYGGPAYYQPAPVVVTPGIGIWGGSGYRGGGYGYGRGRWR